MLYGSIRGMRFFFFFFLTYFLLLTILNNGSHTMTLDQGNLQSYKRTACGPQPALHCGGVALMNFCLLRRASVQRQSLTLCTSSWHVMGLALGLAAGAVTQLGGMDVGKPLTRTVQQRRHVGPDPGVALLSPFICLFCELLSFFPWRKDTSSNLAERENLTHTCLLWLWYPARGKGQSPEVMMEWAELIESQDVHPPLSCTGSL